MSWGTLGRPFWGLGVALGINFGGLRVPQGAFGAQSAPKTLSPDPHRSIFGAFGVQREIKRLPKCSPRGSKNELRRRLELKIVKSQNLHTARRIFKVFDDAEGLVFSAI